MLKVRPGGRYLSEGAGDDLHMNSPLEQQRNHDLEFTISNKRIAADDGQVQRLEPINDFQHSIDKFLILPVIEAAQSQSSAKMSILICIAPRTAKRTFLRDLNG